MASNRVTTDLTRGNPLKMTVMFAIPIFLSNILQQIYILTDVGIIGHTLGDDALSAMGTVTTIYGFFNSLMFGMASGFSVVISRFFGSKDEKGLKKAVANTVFLSAIWAVGVPLAGLLSLKPLMRALDTPVEVFDSAYSYASIVITLLSFSFIYNVLRSILQSIGNSRAPLYFLLISVTTNIILDLLFVRKLGWGLPGAAYATGIAQALSSVITFIYICICVPQIHISRKDMVLDKYLVVELFSSGLAFALMFTVVNLGSMILQSAINNLGKTIIAAHVAARKIAELCMMMLSTLANAMATFSGQNYGAGRYDRIKQGLKSVLLFSFGLASFLIFMVYLFGDEMVVLISGSSNEELIKNAVFYLRFDVPFFYVLAVLVITRTTLQGMGAKFVPVIASVMELVLKIVTAKWLAVKLGYLGVAICEPVIWLVCGIFIIIVFMMRIRKSDLKLQT